MRLRVLSAASFILASCAPTGERAASGACDSRAVVLDFYNQALIGREPRAAFERFAAPSFVEHKPDVPDGSRESVTVFLEGLIAELPDARWEVVRTIAEKDMVFVHARFSPAPGAGDYAIADIFRVEDCLIAEHWDVVAGPPDAPANPNTRF